MTNDKRRLGNTLILDGVLLLIIAAVYVAAFLIPGTLIGGPVMRADSGGESIGIQIAVDDATDIFAYMDMLEEYGAQATFFLREDITDDALVSAIRARGYGVGFYLPDSGMYIGGGTSIPVMSCETSGEVTEVGPSIDVSKMAISVEWEQTLVESLESGMFVYFETNDDFSVFEKTVQIAADKGYTMLKINEMLETHLRYK